MKIFLEDAYTAIRMYLRIYGAFVRIRLSDARLSGTHVSPARTLDPAPGPFLS